MFTWWSSLSLAAMQGVLLLQAIALLAQSQGNVCKTIFGDALRDSLEN